MESPGQSMVERERSGEAPGAVDPHPFGRHLLWVLGVAAALLVAGIEVALIAMPEAGMPTRPPSDVVTHR